MDQHIFTSFVVIQLSIVAVILFYPVEFSWNKWKHVFVNRYATEINKRLPRVLAFRVNVEIECIINHESYSLFTNRIFRRQITA